MKNGRDSNSSFEPNLVEEQTKDTEETQTKSESAEQEVLNTDSQTGK